MKVITLVSLVYLCLCLFLCVSMCLFQSTCGYVSISVYVWVCVSMCGYVSVSVYVWVCVSMCEHVSVSVYVWVCVAMEQMTVGRCVRLTLVSRCLKPRHQLCHLLRQKHPTFPVSLKSFGQYQPVCIFVMCQIHITYLLMYSLVSSSSTFDIVHLCAAQSGWYHWMVVVGWSYGCIVVKWLH